MIGYTQFPKTVTAMSEGRMHRSLFLCAGLVCVSALIWGDGVNAGHSSGAVTDRRRPQQGVTGLRPTIEGPRNALDHFYARLAAAERQVPNTLVRIAFYSDSVNGWDGVSSALRHALQDRFGDGGKGWIHIAPGWTYQHHRDVRWSYSDDWRTHVVNRGRSPGNRYGFGGVMAADGSRRSYARYETTENHPSGSSVSRFQVFYQAFPGAGSFRLTVDGGEPTLITTASERMVDRMHEVRVPDGPHRFQVAVGERNVRLYGVVMEREGPGVVVDAVALIGARVARLLRFDAEHWRRQIELRQPDLLLFWIGGNNVTSQSWGREAFIRDFGQAIANARRGRAEASCLVTSVPDMGERGSGESISRIPELIEAQMQVATTQGCGFFNLHRTMGGPGTMNRWYRGSPRLATPDFRHLTPRGAQRVGDYFREAIISGYESYRSRQGRD